MLIKTFATATKNLTATRIQTVGKLKLIGILFIALYILHSGFVFADDSKTSESKADSTQKSASHINPSTLAMEMTISLGMYSGRNGNSIPLTFNYSSKVWEFDQISSVYRRTPNQSCRPSSWVITDHQMARFKYARNNFAGWTSSLTSPRIIDQGGFLEIRHSPTPADSYLEDNFFLSSETNSLFPEFNFDQGDGPPQEIPQCSYGYNTGRQAWCTLCCKPNGNCSMSCSTIGGNGGTNPQGECSGGGGGQSDPPAITRANHIRKRILIRMPDGSTADFRKDDVSYVCAMPFSQSCFTRDGVYLSVDGSNMRFVYGEIQPDNSKLNVLYLPNGTRYIFSNTLVASANSYGEAVEMKDVDGNKSFFDTVQRKWTDTLAREITDPFPLPDVTASNPVSDADQTIDLPSLPGAQRQAQLIWKKLKNPDCEDSNNAFCGDNALEDPAQELSYIGSENCGGGWQANVNQPALFPGQSNPPVISGAFTYDTKRLICGNKAGVAPARFNPVVLAEIVLPNNTKYEFKYNVYGEITKITYPTGSVERFRYDTVVPMGYLVDAAYRKSNRGVVERWVYSNEQTLEQHWTYAAEMTGTIGSTVYTVKTFAPDGTLSERVLNHARSDDKFSNYLDGKTIDEKLYSIPDSSGIRRLLSRTLTEWTQDGPLPGGAPIATRNPRPLRTISIVTEGGKTLATMSETVYDEHPVVNGQPDISYFANLNPKSVKAYHYLPVSLTDAQAAYSTALSTIKNQFQQSGQVASISETDYLYDPNYKARGIPSLPVETRVLNPANPTEVIARTQTAYDEYSPESSGTLSGNMINAWIDPAGDSAIPANSRNLRGKPTTSKAWGSDNNVWIETHTKYDQYGNVRKVWEANEPILSDRFVETQYDSQYGFAYPTTVITPAPDPTGINGTNQGSTASTTYDFATGLSLTVTNDFGQTTATEYSDPLLRPTRTYAVNFVAPETQTIYNDAQLWVKVRKQMDANNWDEATTFSDSLGRNTKTQSKDSQGDVVVQTLYDNLGRVSMTSNPYRVDGSGNASETIYWSKPKYDELSRVVETFAPSADPANSPGASLGTTSFSFSTESNFVGTVVTTSDASGRKGRSITNALGQLLRVDEPTATGGATADADLGTLSNPSQPTFYKYDVQGKMVEVTQGAQHRYFKYDGLGRLIRVRQPEQDVNANLNLADSYNTSGQWTAAFSYDALGNVKRATDAAGTNIVYEYDKADRVTKRCYTKPNFQTTATQCSQISGNESPNTPAVEYFYDGKGLNAEQSPNYAKGKLTKVASSVSETRYTKFDFLGRLTESEQRTPFGNSLPAATDAKVSKYSYNFSGALVEQEYPNGRKVKNEFEADGDLARVYGSASASAPVRTYANSFSFTASDGISQMRLGNGRWETAKFNERLQVAELGLGNSSSDTSLWQVGYEYGELDATGTSVIQSKNTGNIARQTIGFAGLSSPLVQTYRYDSLYRLTEAKETQGTQQNWIQQFGYDRYGNRTAFNQNITGIANGQIAQTPAVDPQTNRFTSNNYSYDLNGNITTDLSDASQVRNFTFDGDNKQTEIKDINGYSIGRYFYDGEGKRVKKVTNLETTVFVYDGLGKLIAEYSTDIAPTPQTKYLTEDHLGTPRIITDATGQITARRDFLPFGEDLFAGIGNRSASQKYGATADDIRQKFTGYQKDRETSLDFAEARMYENRFGRFTAVDPLLASGRSANPQTFNRYVYVQNNPVAATDPSGLCGGQGEPQCPRNYNGPVYTKTDENGKVWYNDYAPDKTWGRFVGSVVGYPSDCGGCRTTFTTLGWSETPLPPFNPIQELVNGFPANPFEQAATGFAKGVGNVLIGVNNTLSDAALNSRNGIYMPSINVTGNPLEIDRYSYDTSLERNWGIGTEGAAIIAPSVAAAPFAAGAGTSLSVIPKSNCFVAGTLVYTENGHIPIEEIKIGDKVLSYNEDNGEFEYQEVVRLFRNTADEFLKIQVEGETEIIQVTLGHPFYVYRNKGSLPSNADDNGDWVLSKSLRVGDLLKDRTGAWQPILSIEKVDETKATYNFEVAKNHDYFVGQKGWLVHNQSFPPIKPGSFGGETAGQKFSQSVRDAAFAENPNQICVFCRRPGTATQVDHAIPKSWDGNATLDNAQLACPFCNQSKGNRGLFPLNPPPGYTGPFPPPHWEEY